MKKSVLLALLPAVLVLSSCSAGPKENPNKFFVEDTKAHEEIFGALADVHLEPIQLQPNKALPSGISLYKPMIGFQRKDNTSAGTYSVRFVAAMQSGTDSASWFRSVHNLNGQVAEGKGKKEVPVTGVYTAINNGGVQSNAVDVEAEDGTKPYDCYAVYCLLNIPSSFSSYYVDAYISVTDNGNTVNSSVGSLNVADADDYLQYSLSGENYIIEVNGERKASAALREGNHYNAFSLVLENNDQISTYHINANNSALTYSYDLCNDVSLGRSFPDFSMSGSTLNVTYGGTYNIFLNGSNQYYFEKKIYFQGPDFWENDSAKAMIQLKPNSGDNYPEYEMISTGEPHQYSAFVDNSQYQDAQFFRQVGNWQGNWTGYKGNSITAGKDMYTRVNLNGDNYNATGAWSVYGGDAPVIDISNFTINELTEAQEIHTSDQAAYLAYQGDYSQMPEDQYPNGKTHQSDPLPITVTFDYNVPSGKSISKYSIVFGKEANLSDGYKVDGDTNKSISFYNPYLGRNYYKLVANFTNGETEESAIHYFDVDSTCPRNLKIDGMTNCRDIGGRVTEDGGVIKQGLVYRTSGENYSNSSGSEDNITSAGKTEMLNHLKVKTEINVSNNDSNVVNLGNGVVLKNLYMDYDQSGTNSSSHFSRNAESLNNFFETLADANNYPVFFHCRIGTDRTGLCAITLNGLLGVPLNQIYQDYLFSNFGKIGEKRYIGPKAGQDNIQNYMNEINCFSGATFKNKVYNCLLSIGLSRTTLDTVIANLTEGTTAQNNNAGQVIARADVLTGNGVSMTTDTSERNHPDYYFTLDSTSKSVSYSFNAPAAYRGQIVAYLGNTEHSTSKKIADAIGVKIDSATMAVRDITYADAGMGKCSSRMNYYPVILGIANIAAGQHTITITGTANTMNIGGIYIFDGSTATDVGGGVLTDPEHVHNFGSGVVIQEPTHTSTGIRRFTCSCGEYYDETIDMIPHEYDSEGVVVTAPTHSSKGVRRHSCSCGAYYDEDIDTIPYSWVSAGSAASGTGTNYSNYNCSHCFAKKIEVVATSGTFASGSSNKSGTPGGFIKLNANGNSITYTFNYSGTGTARLYQRAIVDYWYDGSNNNQNKTYSSSGGGSNNCNFAITFNNSLVDMTATKGITYEEFLSNGVDSGAGSSYSPMDDCLIGSVQLVNGTNSFTYTRQGSYNLLVHDFVIIID